MLKRAFTLIELLVVIAIIAILAAILFPVFAQAKVAAKGTASLSNVKQLNTSSIIYATDYDDKQMLVGFPDATATAYGIRPWTSIMMPYMKNLQILGDPLTTWVNPGFADPNNAYLYCPQYSYAWQIHSPGIYYGGQFIEWNPISQTTLADPANTVFMTTKRTGFKGPEWWWSTADLVIITTFTTGLPHCSGGYTNKNPQSLCGPGVDFSWGVGSIGGETGVNEVEGHLTSGMTVRKTKHSIVSFADGHAKAMRPDALAAGTNYKPTQAASATTITDINKYMWDAD
jgi:prepilin-type N-terminal cleavage/methylation domain-containing protein